MSENQKKILEMLANKKISVDEAYQLLSALKTETGTPEGTAGAAGTTGKPKPKYLHVHVAPGRGHRHGQGHGHGEDEDDENDEHDEHDEDDEDNEDNEDDEDDEDDEHVDLVNVRVPMSLIRSGLKFTSLLPDGARDKVTNALQEKGINLDMRNMKPEDLEEIIDALSDLEVKVVSGKEIVKVFVE